MMQPNEAMKAMALKIVKAHYPEMPADYRGRRYLIALAAIMETQRLDAELAETFGDTPRSFGPAEVTRRKLAAAIRAGEHYALAGGRRG